MQRSDINLSKPQIIFLFHIGFIPLLLLIGTTTFNLARQLVEYYQFGFFYEDCSMWYIPTFDRYSFDACKSDNIIQLIPSFIITSSIFTFTSYRIYNYITKEMRGNKK